jgi:hypothetical protein
MEATTVPVMSTTWDLWFDDTSREGYK